MPGCGDDGGICAPPTVTADAGAPPSTVSDASSTGCDGDAGCAASDLPDGIYVSPTGSDSGLGTPASPLKTIAAGIAAATAAHKAVRLCSPSMFNEAVTIKDAVEISGGVDCTNGKLTTDRAALAPAKGVPLTIRGVAGAVHISRITMKAPDALDPGASSIGAFVVNDGNLSFEQVDFQAGNGADGETPPPPLSVTEAAPAGANGGSAQPAACTNGAWPCNIIPAGGSSTPAGVCGLGGFGGGGGNSSQNAQPQPGGSGLPFPRGGGPGLTGHYEGDPGKPGGDGDIGLPGVSALSGMGTVTPDGYVPSNTGRDGQPGAPGGGGGGGSGAASAGLRCGDVSTPYFYIGGGGGQGGAGGCGGAGGKGAGAGGASIALLSVNSHLSVRSATFDSASGGRGGDSSPGAAGQPGGQGGAGGTSSYTSQGVPSCAQRAGTMGTGGVGGIGGRGGKGGPGGAGGGGPSIAFLVTGIAPTTDAVTYNVGKGGKGGRAITGPDAADGVTAQVMALDIADGGAP